MTDKSEPIIIDGNVVTYDPTIYIIPKLRELSKQGVGIGEKCKQGLGFLNFTPENCMGDWMKTNKDPSGEMIRRQNYSSGEEFKGPNRFISDVNFVVKNPDLTIAKTSDKYKQNWKTLVKTLKEIVPKNSVNTNEESCSTKKKNKIFIATHQGVLLKKFFSLNNENGKIKFANCSCIRITKDNSNADIDIELIHPSESQDDCPTSANKSGTYSDGTYSDDTHDLSTWNKGNSKSKVCTPLKKLPKKNRYLHATCYGPHNLKANLKPGSCPTVSDFLVSNVDFLDSNDIYFIRHGDAIHNAVKTYNSENSKNKSSTFSLSTVFNNVNSPLTPEGRLQSKGVFDHVFRHEIKTISISGENMSEGVNKVILVSSPLDRAIETLMLSTTPPKMYSGAKGNFESIFNARAKLLESKTTLLSSNNSIKLFPGYQPSTGGKHNKTKRHAKRYKKRSISKKRQMKRKTAHSTRKLKKHRRVKQITRKR